MVKATRAGRLLDGFRGSKPGDRRRAARCAHQSRPPRPRAAATSSRRSISTRSWSASAAAAFALDGLGRAAAVSRSKCCDIRDGPAAIDACVAAVNTGCDYWQAFAMHVIASLRRCSLWRSAHALRCRAAPAAAQSGRGVLSRQDHHLLHRLRASAAATTCSPRTISRHMPRHIPGNLTILPVNMPGASSLVLGNHLAKRAPRDGTAIGAVNSALAVRQRCSRVPESKAQFHGPEMTMLGNAVSSAAVLIAWHTTGIKTINDLRQKPLVIGALSRSGDTYLLPLSIKNHAGPRQSQDHHRLSGHARDRDRARARRAHRPGLGHGRAARPRAPTGSATAPSTSWRSSRRRRCRKFRRASRWSRTSVANEDDKKVLDVIFVSTILARPYIAPPGVPADRVKALRDAFMATMKDPGIPGRDRQAANQHRPDTRRGRWSASWPTPTHNPMPSCRRCARR